MDIIRIVNILPEELLNTIRELPWYSKYLHRTRMKRTLEHIRNDEIYPLYPHQVQWVNAYELYACGDGVYEEAQGKAEETATCFACIP